MVKLSDAGRAHVADLANQHAISEAGTLALLEAVQRGHGTAAQFNHPALGGMGQWSTGGMTQIGDMFNDGLKRRVAGLAEALAASLQRRELFDEASGPVSYTPDRGDRDTASWWPAELGTPSATGGQNDDAYALFADRRRLAIRQNGQVRVYDTGEHRIGGFAQQQGGGLRLAGQDGDIEVGELKQVS